MKTIDANIASIAKAIEFIDGNLKEEITIADMADAVFYSLYHFCRMFNKIIHHTPYDYLMRRRLSESARDLVHTDRKIIEIAFEYQFNSPEVYARAFKRMFGMQPNQWRKQGSIPARTLMPGLTINHIRHLNQGAYLKPVLLEKKTFHLAGLMTLVKKDFKEIQALWEMFVHILEEIRDDMPHPKYYGITWYPKVGGVHGFFYMAAVEIASTEITTSALVIKTIPASHYARFVHKGSQAELYLTRDYIYHTWLPKSGKRPAFPGEIEYYGQDFKQTDTEGSERELYIPLLSS